MRARRVDLVDGVSMSIAGVSFEIAFSSLIMRTTSCLSFGERRVSAVEADIPQATKWNFIVDILRGTPRMDIPLRRNWVLRNRLKMCFQLKSDVISSAPHRVLKNSNEERAGDSLLVG